VSVPALRLIVPAACEQTSGVDIGWLEFLAAHVDPAWRRGEWDGTLWLFSGDLGSDRTAAWTCRTPGCPTPAHAHGGRCSSCRRALVAPGSPTTSSTAVPAVRPPGRSSGVAARWPAAKASCTATACAIDGADKAALIARVAELEAVNRRLVAERDARTGEADTARRRIDELEDELTAARESLRRVMRSENRGG
jgi:hypothetical protein